MKELYKQWKPFQAKFEEEGRVTAVAAVGPLWVVTCKTPEATQGIKDKIEAFLSSKDVGVAVFRGKTSFSQLRERVVIAAKQAVQKALGHEKGKAAGKAAGLVTWWPDLQQ